jgi:hypothetical protein
MRSTGDPRRAAGYPDDPPRSALIRMGAVLIGVAPCVPAAKLAIVDTLTHTTTAYSSLS